jgi:hypothetical protein
MKTFFNWAAGIFEDQKGSASSKRIGFFWAFSLLTYMIVKSTNGSSVDGEMFWAVFTIILVGYGLITSEYFKKPGNVNDKLNP